MEVVLDSNRTELTCTEHPGRRPRSSHFMHEFSIVAGSAEKALATAVAGEGQRSPS